MSKPARVAEPSMEEILASIRRIIADDTGAQAQTQPRPAPRAVPEPAPDVESGMQSRPGDQLPESVAEADILELTQPVEPDPPPSFTPVRGPDVVFREEEPRAPEPPPPPLPPAPPMARSAPPPEERLLSTDSSDAVSAAFNSLATTVLSDNARTLEDIVKEMMRPMLKHWLDENLPGMVERIVRAEIERVARGGR